MNRSDLPPVVLGGGAELAALALRDNVRAQGFKHGKLPPLRLPELAPPATTSRKQSMADDRRKVKFDPTINLGHILTFVGFIGTGFGAYSLLEKRVTVLEVHIVRAQQDNATAREELRDTTRIMREDMKEVRKSVDELTRSIAGRADRR